VYAPGNRRTLAVALPSLLAAFAAILDPH